MTEKFFLRKKNKFLGKPSVRIALCHKWTVSSIVLSIGRHLHSGQKSLESFVFAKIRITIHIGVWGRWMRRIIFSTVNLLRILLVTTIWIRIRIRYELFGKPPYMLVQQDAFGFFMDYTPNGHLSHDKIFLQIYSTLWNMRISHVSKFVGKILSCGIRIFMTSVWTPFPQNVATQMDLSG